MRLSNSVLDKWNYRKTLSKEDDGNENDVNKENVVTTSSASSPSDPVKEKRKVLRQVLLNKIVQFSSNETRPQFSRLIRKEKNAKSASKDTKSNI